MLGFLSLLALLMQYVVAAAINNNCIPARSLSCSSTSSQKQSILPLCLYATRHCYILHKRFSTAVEQNFESFVDARLLAMLVSSLLKSLKRRWSHIGLRCLAKLRSPRCVTIAFFGYFFRLTSVFWFIACSQGDAMLG